MNAKVIAVDFDQTIALYPPEEWQKDYKTKTCPSVYKAEVNQELIRFLEARKEMGDRIIVYTSRWWGDYNVVCEWLNTNKVPFHDVICGKFKADLFIDDKNANTTTEFWDEEATRILAVNK